MTTLTQVCDFLSRRRVAVVGVSRNPQDFSRSVFREFADRGYDVVPVHPGVAEIEGRQCFGRIPEISPPVDAALLMTRPEVTDQVVRECAESGVTCVWMHRSGGPGAVSPAAVEFCEAHGISVVAGECPLMFLPEPAFPHRLHRLIRRITGRYPR